MRKIIFSGLLTGCCLLLAQSGFAQQGGYVPFNPPPALPPDAQADALFLQDLSGYQSASVYAPGPWKAISERDIRWSRRAWRSLSLTDVANAALNNLPDGTSFAQMLVSGALNGRYKVYDNQDDRFTHELAPEALRSLTLRSSGGTAVLDPAMVTELRIREDWMYVASEHRLVARIVGIAPVIQQRNEQGELVERVAFWVYYPEARPFFASQQLADAGGRLTDNVDKLLEERRFSSTVLETRNSKKPGPDDGPPALIRRQ